MEIMIPDESPWDDHHHWSSLPEIIANNIEDYYAPNVTKSFRGSIFIHEVNSKKNLANIEVTIPLDVFSKPGVV